MWVTPDIRQRSSGHLAVPGWLLDIEPGKTLTLEAGTSLHFSCAVKDTVFQWEERKKKSHPATLAPAGSNRSSRGGNKAAEASDVEGREV